MKQIKNLLLIVLTFILMTGCSSKYPSVKTGAIIGGTAGVLTAVAIGTQDTNSDHAPAIVIAAVILGLTASAIGAGVGYVVDSTKDDEEMKVMIAEQKYLEAQDIK